MGEKRNLQKSTNPNKEKKDKTITIENTPLGTVVVKNSAMNQVIKKLFNTANNGEFLYIGYLYGDIVDKLKNRGLVGIKKQKGNFSQQFLSEISWKNAFANVGNLDFKKNPIEKQSAVEILNKYLPQLLYITAKRALQKKLSTNDSNDANDSNDYR